MERMRHMRIRGKEKNLKELGERERRGETATDGAMETRDGERVRGRESQR